MSIVLAECTHIDIPHDVAAIRADEEFGASVLVDGHEHILQRMLVLGSLGLGFARD